MKPTEKQIQDFVTEWRETERELGESILDGRFPLNPQTFMTWCFGRGYLTGDQYNAWVADYRLQALEATDENYFVYTDDGESVPYAVVIDESMHSSDNDDLYEKAIAIVGEFILSIDAYGERWNDFVQKVKNDDEVDE